MNVVNVVLSFITGRNVFHGIPCPLCRLVSVQEEQHQKQQRFQFCRLHCDTHKECKFIMKL